MFGFVLMAQLAAAPPWVENNDFPKPLQEKALAATLRLKNQDTRGEGTAVRIKRIGAMTYYLTAAHNIGKSKAVNLEAFHPTTFPKVDRQLQLVDVKEI